jgi:hypothetical protein
MTSFFGSENTSVITPKYNGMRDVFSFLRDKPGMEPFWNMAVLIDDKNSDPALRAQALSTVIEACGIVMREITDERELIAKLQQMKLT